jgi:hypothetical protein
MAIEFKCPHCGYPYMLKEEFGGKEADCRNPECKKTFIIPLPNDPRRGNTDKPNEAI